VTVTGSKFVSTAREDKYGAGEIGMPQIGTIGAVIAGGDAARSTTESNSPFDAEFIF
jgi:hypothetical protein